MLITCVGRRVELIRSIKKYIDVHVADSDVNAPALYETNNRFIKIIVSFNIDNMVKGLYNRLFQL